MTSPPLPLHVVIGAGPVGSHVARRAAALGHPVRVVTRHGGPPPVPGSEHVAGDVSDVAVARSVCEGAGVVVNCANPPYTRWPELFPAIQRGAIEGAAAAGAVLAVMDNCYGYGPVTGPITEDLPLAATTRKGAVRAAMAEELVEAHRAGKVRTTAARASDFYGPMVTASAAGEQFFAPVIAGTTVRVLGDPDALHSFAHVPDVADALVTLATDERAWGRAWHVPHAAAVTQRELAATAGREAGTTPKVAATPRWIIRALGVAKPEVRELVELYYEFAEDFVVDDSAYRATFGGQATPLDAGLAATVAWYRSRTATPTPSRTAT
jgi:nucleoside-diphosphate-sugar epimerase